MRRNAHSLALLAAVVLVACGDAPRVKRPGSVELRGLVGETVRGEGSPERRLLLILS